MLKDITHICKTCKLCQISKRLKGKYSKIPPKDPDAKPWHTVCVDCMGPLSIKLKKKDKKVKEYYTKYNVLL